MSDFQVSARGPMGASAMADSVPKHRRFTDHYSQWRTTH